jgi:hypothetical protein
MSNVYGSYSAKYAAPGSQTVKELSMLKKSALKTHFNAMKGANGLLNVKDIEKCLHAAGIGEQDGITAEHVRKIMKIAPSLVGFDRPGLTFPMICTLARNAFDVNMLHHLFEAANSNTRWEKIECFLDADEIAALYQRLGVKTDRTHIENFIEGLDRDGDGRVDWEEFLTFSQELLGGQVVVADEDPDGTDFSQLREHVDRFRLSLQVTGEVVAELSGEIEGKQREIEKAIEDTSMLDVKAELRREWDKKDKLELAILEGTTKYFTDMEKQLESQDAEKQKLVEEFEAVRAKRDAVRRSTLQMRRDFREQFNQQFGHYDGALDRLEKIKARMADLFRSLKDAEAVAERSEKVWTAVDAVEKDPKVSSSDAAIEFLAKQSHVLDQIMVKMQMMQRERDKYEEMIDIELGKNKDMRMEIINMNLALQMMDSKMLALTKKYREQLLQHKALGFEVSKAHERRENVKMRQLRKTCEELEARRSKTQEKIQGLEAKIVQVTERTQNAARKGQRLQIELGELKLLLERISED